MAPPTTSSMAAPLGQPEVEGQGDLLMEHTPCLPVSSRQTWLQTPGLVTL